jgi:thioester reductase-like protein
MEKPQLVITGADGYLGLLLARRFLVSTAMPVLLWVRARDATAFRLKQQQLMPHVGHFGARVTYGWGDLTHDQPFASIDPTEVRLIIHSAAVTRFTVDAITARQVNVEGTAKLLRFASACPALEAVGLLSTIYASGLIGGVIDEVPFLGREGFCNHYERSKWESETLLQSQFASLPWRLFRIATVIADDDTGAVTQHNVFHNTLKLFYHGLLPFIPGQAETPLYFVTGTFVTEAIYALMQQPEDRVIYHVSHHREAAVSLEEVIALAFAAFLHDRDFRLRRPLKPLYTDATSFQMLTEEMNIFGGDLMRKAMARVAPFAKQLFVCKEIDNRRLRAAWGAYRAMAARSLVQQTCEYLVRTQWGTRGD